MWMSRKPLTPYFYPRPLRGGRRGVLSFDGTKSEFLSTPSARRATPVRRGAWSRRGYFYPRPLRGGRPRYLVPPRASFSNFYPRPLRGGRLGVHAVSMFSPIFLSTPSARRATITCCSRSSRECISIHALCEEGDLPGRAYGLIYNISIHALCEEGDVSTLELYLLMQFLSTPSARRATSARSLSALPRRFLSTPSARRATCIASKSALLIWISIHALREEGDVKLGCTILFEKDFYPRPPRGGRPHPEPSGRNQNHFYPRPPRGGRRTRFITRYMTRRFLSTPSARRATASAATGEESVEISIHALREEGDLPSARTAQLLANFYPRPPRGGRQD